MFNIIKILKLLSRSLVMIMLTMDSYGYSLSNNCGKSVNMSHIEWRIIGGRDAEVGEFPWYTLIHTNVTQEHKESNFCGGAIISERWVLTAAHCLQSIKAEELKLRLGVHNFTNEQDQYEVDFYVEKFIIHEKYSILNDLALIKLKQSIDFNGKHKHLTPICLPKSNTQLTTRCIVTGFGVVNETNKQRPKNGILQKLDESIIDSTYCKKQFPGTFDNKTNVCAGDVINGRRGVCFMDSGGPLQCQGFDGLWYEVGIVAYGVTPCSSLNKIDVFMKVSAYSDWIQKTMANN